MEVPPEGVILSPGAEITLKSPGTRRAFLEALERHLKSRLEVVSSVPVIRMGVRFLLPWRDEVIPVLRTQFGLSVLYRYTRVDGDAPEGAEVEMTEWGVLALHHKERLPGGYPVGVGGSVLQLFSGGPDSVLASLLMARRGQRVSLLFMDTGAGRDFVLDSARDVAFFMPGMEVELFIVHFVPVLEKLKGAVPSRMFCLFCKGAMLHLASRIAKEHGFQAVSTGEILGEQASQTLPAVTFIERASEVSVLRPLVAFNKEEVFENLRRFHLKGDYSMPSCPHRPKRVATVPRVGLDRFLRTVRAAVKSSGVRVERIRVRALL